MPSGIIFDIQRFALHDGPGIRTAVFLKGCPLSCLWCANPESQQRQPQLGFMAQFCINCLACLDACANRAHAATDSGHVVRFDRCRMCGECVAVCPSGALKEIGATMTVENVMDIVCKDQHYYEKTGGGLTLSGGEPMQQFDFTLALLQEAKDFGLNTCLETSGYAPPEKLARLLPFVDYFLFDFKLADDHLHQHYTGVSNKLILENLALLDKNNARLLLRCPVIPGINDTDDHFRAIATLSLLHKNIRKVQLIPFHDYGRGKSAEIGRSYPMTAKAVQKEQIARWLQQLNQLGCAAEQG